MPPATTTHMSLIEELSYPRAAAPLPRWWPRPFPVGFAPHPTLLQGSCPNPSSPWPFLHTCQHISHLYFHPLNTALYLVTGFPVTVSDIGALSFPKNCGILKHLGKWVILRPLWIVENGLYMKSWILQKLFNFPRENSYKQGAPLWAALLCPSV